MSSERPRQPIFPDERTAVWRPANQNAPRARRSFWRWFFDGLYLCDQARKIDAAFAKSNVVPLRPNQPEPPEAA